MKKKIQKSVCAVTLCLSALLCACAGGDVQTSDTEAFTDTSITSDQTDESTQQATKGEITLEPLSPTKTQAPAVVVTSNLNENTVLVAGICENDSTITVNGEYTKDLRVSSYGEDFVFSVEVPKRKSDTLSITAKVDGKEESKIASVKVKYDSEAEDTGLFVTTDGRICQNEILDDLYHSDLFTRNETTLIRKLAQDRVSDCKRAAGKDVQVIYLLVPNPLTIYQDGLSEEMKSNIETDDSRMKQAVRALESVNGVTVIDLTSVMNKHKDENIYYYTDTHWTELGAYYGYVELMNEIAKKFPSAVPHALSDYDIKNVTVSYTDMMTYAKTEDSGMRETAPFLISKYTPLAPYDAAKKEEAYIWDFTNEFFAEGYSTSKIDNDELPSGIILFDSFGLNAISFIAEHFSTLTCQTIWTYSVDYDLVEEQKPDYIIELISERTLGKLLSSK